MLTILKKNNVYHVCLQKQRTLTLSVNLVYDLSYNGVRVAHFFCNYVSVIYFSCFMQSKVLAYFRYTKKLPGMQKDEFIPELYFFFITV